MGFLEAFGIDWKILLGQIINFLIVFLVIKKFFWPNFQEVLEVRRKKIEEGLKKAEESQKAFAKIRELEKEILAKANKKGEEIIKQSNKIGQEKLKVLQEKISEREKKMLEELKAEIKQKKRELEAEMRKKYLDMVKEGSAKVLSSIVNEKIDKKIIEAGIKQLEHEKGVR